MNKADKDAQKWYRTHARMEARRLIEAKELGKPYYIDRGGYVITPDKLQENSDKDKNASIADKT